MKKTKTKHLPSGSEWTFEYLDLYEAEISRIAEKYKIETYRNQIEIISSEQMMDAYSSVGMPLGYSHWSFGKQFLTVEKGYKRGDMGLAYELVINSNPCISYLMEENTLAMQALVIAHACYGHNSFFKNNYLFKTWTNADSIVDYLLFAKKYVASCEEKHGIDAVESLLDACHALMNNGVDKYKRPPKLSIREEALRQEKRSEHMQSLVNEIWRTLPRAKDPVADTEKDVFPEEPQENILYFIEKNAPLLEGWQREIVRIVRKTAQYFYPQRQTKVMNEGWATFWHYTIMQELYSEGLITDTLMLEILHNHTNVIYQPSFDSPHYSGINPYTLGFSMWQDIRRICEDPTEEDKIWFPEIAGSNWVTTLDFAMRNYKDESFIGQFLSPKLMRDLKLFNIIDDDKEDLINVSAIHDENGYQAVRQALSAQYNLANVDPDIQVVSVDRRGDRSMVLRYTPHGRRPLHKNAEEVMKHLYSLWGFPVKLEVLDEIGTPVTLFECGKK